MSANAKQTAINQAAQIAMNRGQFQPFYYYTANNTNGQTVQLHGYPGMIGMPNPQLFAHPQFAYNFYAHAQAQALHQHQQPNNNQGLLATPPSKKLHAHKGKVSNTNSHGSDHGLGLNSNSKSDSGSENGTHNSCDMDKSTVANTHTNKNDNSTKTNNNKNKKKNKKPSKKVIVIDLPEDLQSIETVTNKCQKYGEILLVRVLKPGKVLPFDLKMYSGKIHDLGQTTCAIIEFESPIAALATVEAESELSELKCALLQQGADIALYGNHNESNLDISKASSELGSHGESEHTHGESGIGERSAGTRSESTHSDENSFNDNSISSNNDNTNQVVVSMKPTIKKEITLEKSINKNNIF